jgi:hypothetical protein
MGASLKDYINDKGSWKFLNEYKSFLDDKTAWYRPMNPGKVLMWQQQIEDTGPDGRSTLKGLKGTLQGVSFDQNDTTGVGGAIRYFFYEEAGIAPSMDKTVEYLCDLQRKYKFHMTMSVADLFYQPNALR